MLEIALDALVQIIVSFQSYEKLFGLGQEIVLVSLLHYGLILSQFILKKFTFARVLQICAVRKPAEFGFTSLLQESVLTDGQEHGGNDIVGDKDPDIAENTGHNEVDGE